MTTSEDGFWRDYDCDTEAQGYLCETASVGKIIDTLEYRIWSIQKYAVIETASVIDTHSCFILKGTPPILWDHHCGNWSSVITPITYSGQVPVASCLQV